MTIEELIEILEGHNPASEVVLSLSGERSDYPNAVQISDEVPDVHGVVVIQPKSI